jgi:hypothetical protein
MVEILSGRPTSRRARELQLTAIPPLQVNCQAHAKRPPDALCWRDLHPLEWQLASLHQIPPCSFPAVGSRRRSNAIEGRSLAADLPPTRRRAASVTRRPGSESGACVAARLSFDRPPSLHSLRACADVEKVRRHQQAAGDTPPHRPRFSDLGTKPIMTNVTIARPATR